MCSNTQELLSLRKRGPAAESLREALERHKEKTPFFPRGVFADAFFILVAAICSLHVPTTIP